MHRQTLFLAATFLESTQHDLAFIGETGVGKTFALCWLTRLVLDQSDADRLTDRMVLEVGQGWTTLCEVRIQRGPRYGLIIDPQGENELRHWSGTFVHAWPKRRPTRRRPPTAIGASPRRSSGR